MNSTHIITQQLLESLHARLCRLEYLSGKLKRPLEGDPARDVLREVYAENLKDATRVDQINRIQCRMFKKTIEMKIL